MVDDFAPDVVDDVAPEVVDEVAPDMVDDVAPEVVVAAVDFIECVLGCASHLSRKRTTGKHFVANENFPQF